MKKIKKVFSVTILTAILALPAITALAYTHSYTFNFKYGLNSNLYTLNPTNDYVYIENTSNTYGGSPTSNVYYVDLFYADSWGSSYVGTTQFPRDGSTIQGIFTNEGGGKYWFKMSKSDDGEYVDGYGRITDWNPS